jgi:hypothetical protein
MLLPSSGLKQACLSVVNLCRCLAPQIDSRGRGAAELSKQIGKVGEEQFFFQVVTVKDGLISLSCTRSCKEGI